MIHVNFDPIRQLTRSIPVIQFYKYIKDQVFLFFHTRLPLHRKRLMKMNMLGDNSYKWRFLRDLCIHLDLPLSILSKLFSIIPISKEYLASKFQVIMQFLTYN